LELTENFCENFLVSRPHTPRHPARSARSRAGRRHRRLAAGRSESEWIFSGAFDKISKA